MNQSQAMAGALPPKARAAVYSGPLSLNVEAVPVPELSDCDLLVESEIAGVDGSEVHLYRGELDEVNRRAPVIPGDEIIGRVVAIGAAAASRRGLVVGDRVSIESRWPCLHCRACRNQGNYYACESRSTWDGYGTLPMSTPGTLWGAYSTHVFASDDALIHRVPDDLPIKTALIASSILANGVAWTSAGKVTAGDQVTIFGPGPQGLSCAVVSALKDASVTLMGLDRDRERLAAAAEMGLGISTRVVNESDDPSSRPTVDLQDVVIDLAGVPAAKRAALSAVRNGGRFVSAAVPSPQIQQVDWLSLLIRNITIVCPVSHPYGVSEAFELAGSLLSRGIDVGDWITHEFSLDHITDALLTAAFESSERPVKVAITSFPNE